MNMSFKKKIQSIAKIIKPLEDRPIIHTVKHNGFGKENHKEEHRRLSEVVCNRQQLSAPYDSNIVKDIFTQSDRYKNLKPTVALQILCEQRNKYKYLKRIAISRLEANLKKQLSIYFQTIEIYRENSVMPSDELFHNIFSWKWNDFLIRRRLTNFVWVDVLLRMEEKPLHVYKFQKDFHELQFMLEKIFTGLFSHIGERNFDISRNIERPIDEAKQVMHTTDYIEDELDTNSKELKHLLYKEHFFMNAKRMSEDNMLKIHLENRIWNSHIRDPIEVRYHLKWFQNIVKQNEYHIEKVTEKYETDVAQYKQMLNLETFISDNCMDYCYSSIEAYKNRMETMQAKFDKELVEMENKLTHLRLQIDKLKEQRKWLSVEIERFHEEEENMRIRIEMKKEKEILQSEKKSKTLNANIIAKKQRKKNRY